MTTKLTGSGVVNYSSGSQPSSPVAGQIIFNTTTQKMEYYDGSYWRDVNEKMERPYLYRQIITTGYVCGGYKDGIPYLNVNRMVHSTDVMTNLGNQMPRYLSYGSGACNLTKGFFWGTNGTGGHPTTGTEVAAFNMATETSGGYNSSTWGCRTGRNDAGTVFKEHEFAYIQGGGSGDIDVFNLTNETMYKANIGPDGMSGDNMQSGATSFSDEFAGYTWGNGANKILFSTTVAYSITDSNVSGSGSQQKGISSKLNRGYCGNEGDYMGGYNLRRWDLTTDTNLGTVAKPVGNSGEENFDMGQDHQYMMGCYDGAQNNRGWKFSYTTNSGSELGTGSVRTGPPGGSSGHCCWKG